MNDTAIGTLIQLNLVLLVPVVIFLALVLYQVLRLLTTVSGFVSMAQYELSPALKDVRLTAGHVETLSAKAVGGVNSIEKGVEATGPVLKEGVDTMRRASGQLQDGAQALFSGIVNAFSKTGSRTSSKYDTRWDIPYDDED